MNGYTVDLPSYTIGTQAYDAVGRVCLPLGKRAALLVGHHGYPRVRAKLDQALAATALELTEPILVAAECTEQEVERLAKLDVVRDADQLLVVGGGKVIDTVKAVAERVAKPVSTFPTIASNCAATTAVSIMYREDGSFERPYFLTQSPHHCFMDTELLAQAPTQFLWAGMGDTYAKYYEASIASRGEELNHPLTLGVHLSKLCAETTLRYGEQALEENRLGQAGSAFEQIVLTILVTTGLVSILVTLDHSPDYNSDLAHAIYYTLTRVPGFDGERHLHGAAVGYGVLILLLVDSAYEAKQREAWEQVHAFNRAVKLPVCLADLDLSYDDVEPYLAEIADMPDVRHHPYRITVDMVKEAIMEQERWANAR